MLDLRLRFKHVRDGEKVSFLMMTPQTQYDDLQRLHDLLLVLGSQGFDSVVNMAKRKIQFQQSVQTLFNDER